MQAERTFRPTGVRAVAVAVVVVAVAVVTTTLATGGTAAGLSAAGLPALVGVWAWAAFWRPEVEVSDGGITVRNVLRTVHVPWPSLRGVEVTGSLRLATTRGSFTAWAAPARSGTATRLVARRPETRRVPTSGAEAAAAEIVDRWAALRAVGYLDPDAARPGVPPVVRWHVGTMVLLGALGVAATTGRLLT